MSVQRRGSELTVFPSFSGDDDAQNAANAAGESFLGGFITRLFRPAIEDSSPRVVVGRGVEVDGELQPAAAVEDDNASVADSTPEREPSPEHPRRMKHRLSSMFRGSSSLQDYNHSEFRRYWMPDSTVKECYECHEKFNAFRRKHHCRLCGQIFCSACTKNTINGSDLGYTGVLRVCTYCENNIDLYLSSSMTRRRRGPLLSSNESSSLAPPFPFLNDPGVNGHASASSLFYVNSDVNSTTSMASLTNGLCSTLPASAAAADSSDRASRSSAFDDAQSVSSKRTIDEPYWVKQITASHRSRLNTFELGDSSQDETSRSTTPPPRPAPVPVSARRSNASAVDLTKGSLTDQFERHLEALLDFMFAREQLDPEAWKPVLWPLSREIAATVKVDVAGRGTEESMNILRYVHVKRIQLEDAEQPEYEVIYGVACSKSLLHSDMPRHLSSAYVMVLEGGIDYEREQKLTSIEPIIEQESEFLRHHVDRITSRKANLLLVEQSVARVAVDFLVQAGVAVITGVKRSVIERVARSTNATPTSIMDAHMHPGVVGFCPKFKEQVFNVANGEQKRIIIFDDCPPDRGVTVLLRAKSRRELRAAKRILKLLVLLRYSSGLEVAFLEFFGTKPTLQVTPKCQVCQLNAGQTYDETNAFLEEMAQAVLSNSPLISFLPPYLETPPGKKCFLVEYHRRQPIHFFTEAEHVEHCRAREALDWQLNNLTVKCHDECARIDDFKDPITKKRDIDPGAVARFRAKGGLFFNARREKKLLERKKRTRHAAIFCKDFNTHMERLRGPNFDVFNPVSHQRIVVLYSSFLKKSAPSLCDGPWPPMWTFYGIQDRTLGTFLIQFCFSESYKCRKCNKAMIDHRRKFVHKNARIEITTQLLVKPSSISDDSFECVPPSVAVDGDGIYAWRACPTCKVTSSTMQVTPMMWHMSFAKFVDYLANGVHCISMLFADASPPCEHCTFHEHHHYFSRRNYATCFKVIPVQPLHVTFAPIICLVEPQEITCLSIGTKVNEARQLAATIFSDAENVISANEVTLQAADGYSLLAAFVEDRRSVFDQKMVDFKQCVEHFWNQSTVLSDNETYLEAMDAFTTCRQFLFTFMQSWNQAKTLYDLVALARRAVTRTSRSGSLGEAGADDVPTPGPTATSNSNGYTSVTTNPSVTSLAALSASGLRDVPAGQIALPLPKNFHWELPFNEENIPVVVRDMLDSKGNTHPDIGSIIAYALTTQEYATKRRQLREYFSDQNEPLTLRKMASLDSAGPKDANANITIKFEDSRACYEVKVYYAEHFNLLRRAIFARGEHQFIRSLSTSSNWHPQGGKSGASFFRTQDERFVFKQLSGVELDCFRKCAPNYFDYIYTAVTEKRLTALCKIYGVFQVVCRNKQGGQDVEMDLLVMEFLFYKKSIKQLWDLKGSLRNRYASPKSAAPVLLDENLVQDLWGNQIYVHPHSKAALNQAIANDSHFLTSLGIMDYSLLAGICDDTDEVYIGIVDYMRTYTLDKKLESIVKTALPTPHLPTIVSPEAYRKRFCEAIDIYFPLAPNQWSDLNSETSKY